MFLPTPAIGEFALPALPDHRERTEKNKAQHLRRFRDAPANLMPLPASHSTSLQSMDGRMTLRKPGSHKRGKLDTDDVASDKASFPVLRYSRRRANHRRATTPPPFGMYPDSPPISTGT